MTNHKIFLSIILISFTALLSLDVPKGWLIAGSKPDSYEMGTVDSVGVDGSKCATINSINKKINGFGTLMQQCMPDKYFNKRIKMTGYIKSVNVVSWAGMWLRVDEAGTNTALAFDNMQNRPIQNNTDWTKYEIVLDVPDKASNIAYGALLNGTGQIWFDKINFEIVDKTVPLTCLVHGDMSSTVKGPLNLDFEE